MPCSVGGGFSNVVDIFNADTGTWTTAALSQARNFLAATSLPNEGVAIFAGGEGMFCCVCLSCCRMGLGARGCMIRVQCGVLMMCASLMPCAASNGLSNVLDFFNVTAGTWSTAALSQARGGLAAASLPNAGVAIFAGGYICTCYCVYLSF